MEATPEPVRVLEACIRQRWLLLKLSFVSCGGGTRALSRGVALKPCKAAALTSGALLMRRWQPLDQRSGSHSGSGRPEDTERLKKDKMATGPDTFFSLF